MKDNLKRAQDEITRALNTATAADRKIDDPADSSIDADTFKQIARGEGGA